MRFKISRTSMYNGEKPHPKAFEAKYTRIDGRTVDDPKKIIAHLGNDGGWYKSGKNHRVENGHIMRDFDEVGWFIEIHDMKDILSIVEEFGEIIIGTSWENHSIMEIEIYDSYRE